MLAESEALWIGTMIAAELGSWFCSICLNTRGIFQTKLFVHPNAVGTLLMAAVANHLCIITRCLLGFASALSVDISSERIWVNSFLNINLISMSFNSGNLKQCYFTKKCGMWVIVIEGSLLISTDTLLFVFGKVDKQNNFIYVTLIEDCSRTCVTLHVRTNTLHTG